MCLQETGEDGRKTASVEQRREQVKDCMRAAQEHKNKDELIRSAGEASEYVREVQEEE